MQTIWNRRPMGRLPIGHTLLLAAALGLVLALAAGVARGGSAAAAPSNTGAPTISGTPQQGQELTAATGTWTGDQPISYGFQWQRCDNAGANCGAISGATDVKRTVESVDVGGTLRVVVTATNATGVSSATSAPTSVISPPGAAPTAVKQPDPHGRFEVGQTINTDTGSWQGSSPITYAFRWQRCSAAGTSCADISGANGQTYPVSVVDLGLRLRAIVTAINSVGNQSIASNLTPVIVSPGAPVNTVAPTIAAPGGLVNGATVSGNNGTWIGDGGISYTYSWNRCDAAGKNCKVISGENRSSHVIADSSIGGTLVFSVRATNGRGSAVANSAPTAVIKASGLPSGAIRLSDGRTSIPASSVVSPQRLVISGVSFSPTVIRTRNTFSARFRVTDTRGYVIRDALVYAVGLPYSYVRAAPEIRTGTDGYAVINITPTGNLPIKNGGAIVFFVRARKSGEPLLAGVSTRRLVQVTVRK